MIDASYRSLLCLIIVCFAVSSPQFATGQSASSETQNATPVEASSATESSNTDDAATPRIPYERFVLANGLTLVVSEKPDASLVNVRVLYHAGKDQGKYAHLFEHLFAGGGQHSEGSMRDVLSGLGLVKADATTFTDYTSYFETVPSHLLETALWLEADRMAHPVITEEALDRERKIVQNEKKMRESRPERQIYKATMTGAYPDSHPYSDVGNTREEIDETTVEDMRAWYRNYYGASNVTLVVTGDVETERVVELTKTYFSDIAAGPPVDRTMRWVGERPERKHRRIHASVSDARLRMVWNVPEWRSPGADHLTLAARVLAGSPEARLPQRLVQQEGLASEVDAAVSSNQLGSLFVIDVTAQDPSDLRRIEDIVEAEVADLAENGPRSEELRRAKKQHALAFARNVQRLGRWTEGRSNVLARGELYRNDPGHYRTSYDRVQEAEPEAVQSAVGAWLTGGAFVLDVHPKPQRTETSSDSSRTKSAGTSPMPRPEALPEPSFPEVEQTTLANGLTILNVPRSGSALTHVELVVESGFTDDPDGKSGTARLLLDAIEEQASDAFQSDGAELGVRAGPHTSTITATFPTEDANDPLQRLADIAITPPDSSDVFETVREQAGSDLREIMQAPRLLALHWCAPALYGQQEGRGRPLTGRGTQASLDSIQLADLQRFHRAHVRPGNATLIVSGAADPAGEDAGVSSFEAWEPATGSGETADGESASPPSASGATAPPADRSGGASTGRPVVTIVDREGAEQASVFAAHLTPERATATASNQAAYDVLHRILGGFTTQARLMHNLREEKGWAYRALLYPRTDNRVSVGMRGQEPILAFAPVQVDKTAAAMREIVREWTEIRERRPVTEEEVSRAVKSILLEQAEQLQTVEGAAQVVHDRIAFARPAGFVKQWAQALRDLEVGEVRQAAREILQPESLHWLVVGDADEIEEPIRRLDYGTVEVVDPDHFQ